MREDLNLQPQLIVVFTFGLTFVVTLIVLAIKFPRPTSFQYTVFRTILALAAAGTAAMIPGFINVQMDLSQALLLRAGGALAVFVVVFFYNPAALLLQHEEATSSLQTPPLPATLPNGNRFPED